MENKTWIRSPLYRDIACCDGSSIRKKKVPKVQKLEGKGIIFKDFEFVSRNIEGKNQFFVFFPMKAEKKSDRVFFQICRKIMAYDRGKK